MRTALIVAAMAACALLLPMSCSCGDDDGDDDADGDDTDEDAGPDACVDAAVTADGKQPDANEACVFVVNDRPAGGVFHAAPSVAMNAGGAFALAWIKDYWTYSDEKADYNAGLYLRFFDDVGRAFGDSFHVQNISERSVAYPRIAAGDDRAVVAWRHDGSNDLQEGIYARLYCLDGAPISNAIPVLSYETDDAEIADVMMARDGAFIVHYRSNRSSDSYLRRFDRDGEPVASSIALEHGGDVDADADGNFVLIWKHGSAPQLDVYARRYNQRGDPFGDAFRINKSTGERNIWSDVAMSHSGRFAVAWTRVDTHAIGRDVFARPFEADGTPASDDIRLNEDDTGAFQAPRVDIAADGRFVAVWLREYQSYAFAVEARTFDANGSPSSDVIEVFDFPEATPDFDSVAEVAVNDDGSFVVVVERYNSNEEEDVGDVLTDDTSDVLVRRFDANGNAVCPGE
ncbi:hypothetical protein K8I61_01955 [bacterium]|nr:hypothetical protein [bacterium]